MTGRILWRLIRMHLMRGLEYRGEFLVHMANSVAGPLISLMIWLTVSSQGVQLPYGRQQFVTYYLLVSVVGMLTGAWSEYMVATTIRLGTLSPWLLRPVPYVFNDLANNIGEKMVKLPLQLPFVALLALAFRADLHLPAEPGRWLLFGLALLLAASIAFLLDFVLGSLAFWLEDVGGLIRVKNLLGTFLAGGLVPLALFPRGLSGFLDAQPFRYTLSFPVEILTGSLSSVALTQGLAWQTAYCVLLGLTYHLLWRSGLRLYTATGS